MLNEDFNASPSIPPIIHHLSLYVNRSKARFKPYERNGPSLWVLHFAESSLTPTKSDLSLVDVQNGEHQLQYGLSDLSSEAVLTKEADVKSRCLSAMAMAWQIEATEQHTKFLHMLLKRAADKYVSTSSEDLKTLVPALASSREEELQDHTDFSVAAYSHDAISFGAVDEQLNHLERLARNHYGSGSHVVTKDCKQKSELPAESDASATSSD
ncbi:uncharacterized protein BJ212DRAFT_1299189 [Suillus subaureus]|uniref:Uncharacterized protein n=1 Tax=Suillus subaureus TaxID=48587 RepID=A0A9P7JEH6_9AGAM|nr:uncharacterized protein BJ212DRAFT_1299189 [Suillus subaureus]KAG1817672.1 hypothetical protein BJ212DRAFT_1299189 [Suillus subaureus]